MKELYNDVYSILSEEKKKELFDYEYEEDANELHGDFDFYRGIIRIEE